MNDIYVKKPILVHAFQLTEGKYTNKNQWPLWLQDKAKTSVSFKDGSVFIKTLEGEMRADLNDYIIKGVQDELYPCKPDIFQKTYKPAYSTAFV